MRKMLLFVVLALFSQLSADDLKIASGAGYKKPVTQIVKAYEEKTGNKIDAMFGNMAQIFAHAKQENVVLIFSDKKFLERQKDLSFVNYYPAGKGHAVIAYAKGVELKKFEDLKNANIKRIAMPEAKKAIYGDAGIEFLQNSKLYDDVKDKLVVVATVPQVASYVIASEVEAGVVNLTAVLDAKDKIGGYVDILQEFYTPIEIVVGELAGCKKDAKCGAFLEFLKSDTVKDIMKKNGL